MGNRFLRAIRGVEFLDISKHSFKGVESAVGDYVACGVMPVVIRRLGVNRLALPEIAVPQYEAPKTIPVQLTPITVWHSAALAASGTTYAWGDGGGGGVYYALGCAPQYYELASSESDLPISPIDVHRDIQFLAVGAWESCAIQADRTAKAIGAWLAGLSPGVGINPLPITWPNGSLLGGIVQTVILNCDYSIDGYGSNAYTDTVIYMLREDGTVWHCALDISAYYSYIYGPPSGDAPSFFTSPTYANIDNVVQIAGFSQYDSVRRGKYLIHYAVRADGTVWVRGHDVGGCSGLWTEDPGSAQEIELWTQIPSLNNVVSITPGHFGAIAVDANKDAWGWGFNTEYSGGLCPMSSRFGFISPHNRVFDSGKYGVEYAPVKLPISDVKQAVLCGDGDNVIYLMTGGSVLVIGSNGNYTLGLGDWNENEPTPILEQAAHQITLNPYISDVVCLASLPYSVMALKADGTVWGWGMNDTNELGLPEGHTSVNPETGMPYVDDEMVMYPTQLPINEPVKLLPNIVMLPCRAVSDPLPPPPAPPQPPRTVTSLLTTTAWECNAVIDMCDNAYGWGDSDAYWILGCVSQFPEQAEAWDDLPISKIDVLQDIRAICIRSKSGSVSIRTDGSVWYAGSWTGSDPLPVLGYDSQLFVQVQQAMTFNAECVVDGYAFDEPTSYRNDVIYMLREDGTLWHSFFDIHAYYQMLSSHDYASRLFTVPVYDGIDGVVQISGTVKYDLLMMYALRRDGSVWFRGYDVYGRAGLGNDAGDQVIAVNRWTRLPGLANIISIAVDDDGGFAIDSSGDVWGWGANTRYDRDGEAISTRFGMITASNQSALPYGGGYGVEYAAVKIPLSTVRQVVGFGGGLPGAIYLLEDGTVWAAGICPNGTYYPEEMDDDDYAAQQQAALNIICVPYIKDVASLAAALFTVIALKDGGTVYGWGMYPVQYLGIPDGYVWTSPKTGASYVYSSGDTLYYPTPVPIAQPIKQLANTSTRIVSDISNILADPDGTRCIYGFIRLRIRASVYGMSEIYEPTTTDSYVYAGVRSPTKNYPANLLHKISVSGLSKWAYGRLAEYGVENTAVMPNGQIYATSWGKADKLTPHGQLIWRIVLDPEPSSYATDVAIAPDGSTRISQRKYEESAVHAVNSDGVTLWQCDVDVTGRIATDRYGCTYVTLSDGKICRITALGDIEWTAVASQTSSSCIGVAVDPNGYVYAGTSNGYYAKLDLAGARIWSRWISSGYPIKALAVDVEGRLYYGANVSVIKASTAGDTVWSYDGHQYDVDSIAVGPDGAVYSGGQSLHKTDASGQLIWEYDAGHTTVYQDSGSSFKCTAIDPGCVGAFPEEYGFDV